jgi:anti-anti-sigma factor
MVPQQHRGSDIAAPQPPTTVRLEGDIDAAVREDVTGKLDAAARAARADGGYLAVDLGAVTFMDSTGLGCIASCVAQLGPDGQLALLNVPRSVRRVLELADLDHLCEDAGRRADDG